VSRITSKNTAEISKTYVQNSAGPSVHRIMYRKACMQRKRSRKME